MIASAAIVLVIAVVAFRLSVITVGAPFITIDDRTAFEGGFLVWFGQAPPQRMYVESWVYGLISLVVYVTKIASGHAAGGLGINLVADAYRDFLAHPDAYVQAYRLLILATDLLTGLLVFRIARRIWPADQSAGWAVAAAAMFLLSYNLIWSGVVSRPDSLLTLYCTAGLLAYLRSRQGRHLGSFLIAASILGLAAGQKLHGAFAAIFLCADLLRVHGLREGLPKAALMALVSFLVFVVSTGTLLFDPLLYVKLRMLNHSDDLSPWLQWGDQLVTLLRGAGWVSVPVLILSTITILVGKKGERSLTDSRIETLAVMALGWLVLFACIRQLRAYWMLPAIPVFYIVAIDYARNRLPRAMAISLVAGMVAVLLVQSMHEVRQLRGGRFDELRDWMVSNAGGQVVYVLGFDSLMLPKSTKCMELTSSMLTRSMRSERAAGVSFTERHVRHWEENSMLRLFDMLDGKFDQGFDIYDYYSTPPDVFSSTVGLQSVQIVLLQEGFQIANAQEFQAILGQQFEYIESRYGAGGTGPGLRFDVYRRKGAL
jgi:hypothetical protein